jgi:hypothetical protein
MVAKAAERQHPSSRRIATFARLQCTFEAATVAERHLRVHIAGVGLSASQRYLMRFGRWLPALPGVRPPPGLRMLSYSNLGIWVQAMWVPHLM